MKTAKHTIELCRISRKTLNRDVLTKTINHALDRAHAGGRRKRGWTCKIVTKNWTTPSDIDGDRSYDVKLSCVMKASREREELAVKEDFNNMVKAIAASCCGGKGWQIVSIDGADLNDEAAVMEHVPEGKGRIAYNPVEIPHKWKDNFAHIYERDEQIHVLMSAIKAGVSSGWRDRFHCALVGPPAAGKTETLRAVKAMLGEDSVMEYDATATTQAGAIKDLDDRDSLPRILIVEEIEKTEEKAMRWLLGVMDMRAEIRKVNFKVNIQRETRLLTLATVNDYGLFCNAMYGALASRFAWHINFPEPDEALLRRILEREVAGVEGGKKAWIKPTLEYAIANRIHDPRKVTAICLCGRDELTTGAYQAKLERCRVPTLLRRNHAQVEQSNGQTETHQGVRR